MQLSINIVNISFSLLACVKNNLDTTTYQALMSSNTKNCKDGSQDAKKE